MSLPLGYRYAAAFAGIRKEKRDDVALIVSDKPASAASMFTTNRVQAAPVKVARRHLKSSKGRVRALLVNAGNANCATRTGEDVAMQCCRAAAKSLKTPVDRILPASTGVIGVELDPRPIVNAIPSLVSGLSPGRFQDAAGAILTTDTRMKVAFQEVPLKQGMVRVAGMTKGSGMIQPRMATTLGFVMMDAELSPAHLREMLKPAVERSYHRISVDGDTSTNDMVAVLANGASGVKPSGKERQVIAELLAWVLEDLAEQIARDGEGARKLVTIRVTGTAADSDAERIARAIANSPLVKTAITGSDPNWGRILSAAGYSGVAFDPDKVDVYFQSVLVCRNGRAAEFSEDELKALLEAADCRIRFVINGKGEGQARFWTCDLTEGYIRINASYRT